MRAIIILGLLAMSFCHLLDRVSINRENIERLKQSVEFEVYSYEEHPFKDMTPFELQQQLGLRGMNFHTAMNLPMGDNSDLPESFNAHDKWPQCIHPIRDQQRCGSCWAFAASEVLSDRICIASKGKTNVVLSPQAMVSCDHNDMGCNGGYLDRSWNFLVDTGIVEDSCYPYVSGSGVTGKCEVTDKCKDGSKATYYKAKKWHTYKTVAEIKKDILENGPVETGFLVYSDFMSYKGGIYKKTSNQLMGGHAIKIVGWGVENGTEFWTVANSWGPNWAEQGHFRIAIGNCCNFEAQAIAGDV